MNPALTFLLIQSSHPVSNDPSAVLGYVVGLILAVIIALALTNRASRPAATTHLLKPTPSLSPEYVRALASMNAQLMKMGVAVAETGNKIKTLGDTDNARRPSD